MGRIGTVVNAGGSVVQGVVAVMDNHRDLPINRATGNFVDAVAAAYAQYQRAGGDMVFKQWHDAHAPQHDACTSCYNTIASR